MSGREAPTYSTHGLGDIKKKREPRTCLGTVVRIASLMVARMQGSNPPRMAWYQEGTLAMLYQDAGETSVLD